MDAGFNWQRATNFFEGDLTHSAEVHSIQTGLNFDRYDRWGRTFNRVQNSFAFSGAGATSSFWKVENFFNRLIVLPKNNLLILKAYGQWTPDALPALQQFQLGGQSSVRGFTEGALIGDRGYNLGVEHRFPLPGLRFISPWASQRIQGALFYDLGQVWNDKSNPLYNPKTATLAKTTLLQGVGFGFRAQLTRFMQGFIDVGFGLGDRRAIEPEGRQPTARVHFGVRSDFLPTDYKMRSEKSRLYRQLKSDKKSSAAL
jgi:hemolysin activation/secretion protein